MNEKKGVVIGLSGRGVIETWAEVAARGRLYKLTSDLTSLVPPQFSHWLQVREVGTVYLFIYFYLKAKVNEADKLHCSHVYCKNFFNIMHNKLKIVQPLATNTYVENQSNDIISFQNST